MFQALKQAIPKHYAPSPSEQPEAGRPRRRGGFNPFADEGAFRVTETRSMAQKIDIWLFGEIEDSNQFIDAIEALDAANEGDLVIINLSTNGGNLDSTDTFLQAMRECRARIIVKATGGVHSAGTVILLAAEEFLLSENFNSLIHNGSFGAGGKTSDVKAQAKFQAEYMDAFCRTTYEGFLTDEEIEQLIAGKDFWLGPKEWMERWNKREALLGNDVEENSEEPVDNDD